MCQPHLRAKPLQERLSHSPLSQSLKSTHIGSSPRCKRTSERDPAAPSPLSSNWRGLAVGILLSGAVPSQFCTLILSLEDVPDFALYQPRLGSAPRAAPVEHLSNPHPVTKQRSGTRFPTATAAPDSTSRSRNPSHVFEREPCLRILKPHPSEAP